MTPLLCWAGPPQKCQSAKSIRGIVFKSFGRTKEGENSNEHVGKKHPAPAETEKKDRGSNSRYTETMHTRIVVAVEEDGLGRRDGLQARDNDARRVDGRTDRPADVVKPQVRRRDVAGAALWDVDVFVLPVFLAPCE